ncbi:type II restriction endonuclease subunit M, partial [Escherichia coli]
MILWCQTSDQRPATSDQR